MKRIRMVTACRHQKGALLMAMLVALAVIGMAATSLTLEHSGQQQRDAEEELLFAGEQYRQAIESYWRSSPGSARQWPTKLEDLLNDNRFPQPRHHIRKLFRDPMSQGKPWVEIKLGLSIIGVHSQSAAAPFRRVGFSDTQIKFGNAQTYAEWEFISNARPQIGVPINKDVAPPGIAPGPIRPLPRL